MTALDQLNADLYLVNQRILDINATVSSLQRLINDQLIKRHELSMQRDRLVKELGQLEGP